MAWGDEPWGSFLWGVDVTPTGNLTFNGSDLAALTGVQTSEVTGIHSLAGDAERLVWMPGLDYPQAISLHPELVPVQYKCVVFGGDHAELVTNLNGLKRAVSPRLGFCHLTSVDKPGYRVLAKARSMSIAIDSIPYIRTGVEFPLVFDRHPYWEETAEQSTVVSISGGHVDNDGDVQCYPIYECRPTATLAAGFYFAVTPPGGTAERFSYGASIGVGDVLYVATAPPDVTKNSARDFLNTDSESLFTPLGVGANVITFSPADLSVTVKYRRRYE